LNGDKVYKVKTSSRYYAYKLISRRKRQHAQYSSRPAGINVAYGRCWFSPKVFRKTYRARRSVKITANTRRWNNPFPRGLPIVLTSDYRFGFNFFSTTTALLCEFRTKHPSVLRTNGFTFSLFIKTNPFGNDRDTPCNCI